jgi:membrane-bound lytic murein transglycosylase A
MISALWARSAALAACLWAGFGPAWAAGPGSLKFPDASLEPGAWSQLEGWVTDDLRGAYATFLRSCRAILAQDKPAPAGRRLAESMKRICRRAKDVDPANDAEARAFFEANFTPLRIAKMGDPPGFLTGYYEPIVAGSRFPTPEYTVPIYRRPGDLVAAGIKKKGQLSNKGKVYRKVGRKRVPYYTRAEIEDGALDGRHLEVCWVKDPIDAFFISIQGSARIQLEDGATLRINYDAHNGHRYLPVGRILIDRGEVSKEEMSMERIRQWMLAHPEEGRELRRMNNSYVFYRVTGLSDHQEPIGAQGVSLTPGRSIAVDRHLHLYGTLFWIEAELPIASEVPETKFRRLMVAQDTGSAIVGPSRADIYFGAGEEAGLVGGRIKQPGRFVMLVPREIDPFARWRNVPLPPEKPDGAAAAQPPEPAAPATSVEAPGKPVATTRPAETPVAALAPVPVSVPASKVATPKAAAPKVKEPSKRAEKLKSRKSAAKRPEAKRARAEKTSEQSPSLLSGLKKMFGSKPEPSTTKHGKARKAHASAR